MLPAKAVFSSMEHMRQGLYDKMGRICCRSNRELPNWRLEVLGFNSRTRGSHKCMGVHTSSTPSHDLAITLRLSL